MFYIRVGVSIEPAFAKAAFIVLCVSQCGSDRFVAVNIPIKLELFSICIVIRVCCIGFTIFLNVFEPIMKFCGSLPLDTGIMTTVYSNLVERRLLE